MNEPALATRTGRSGANPRDIQQLIDECDVVLRADPACLHTRAVRGHACMKAKLWSQAVRDFSEILRCRPGDVHGRFSRGMALFRSGRVDDAHQDFSRVLELNPNHVMARYARAGCYNSEGEFHQAIQEYMLALQNDEKESAAGFRFEQRRLDMHGSAGQLIRKTMGGSALRPRSSSFRLDAVMSCSNDTPPSRSKSAPSVSGSLLPPQVQSSHDMSISHAEMCSIPASASASTSRPRKVVQVRVNLSEFASTPKQQSSSEFRPVTVNQPTSQMQETSTPRTATTRVRRPIRKVTVAL